VLGDRYLDSETAEPITGHTIRFGNDPAGSAVHPPAIVAVVVALGHLTHRKHIVQESHVPSQQT
jgi:hypothetical protein